MAVMQDLGYDDDDGQIVWKQQLCLDHVRLRSTSVAVLEVNCRIPEGAVVEQVQRSSGNVEVIAWAITKIVQVHTAQSDIGVRARVLLPTIPPHPPPPPFSHFFLPEEASPCKDTPGPVHKATLMPPLSALSPPLGVPTTFSRTPLVHLRNHAPLLCYSKEI